MYFIFVSSKYKNLDALNALQEDCLSWAIPTGCEIVSKHHFSFKNDSRIVDCYSISPNNKGIVKNECELYLLHGYLLDTQANDKTSRLFPEKNYYGVYSHAKVTHENCWFSTDELGLSPLYYSEEAGYVFVSNNPNLIAIYKNILGMPICPEPSLALWHTIGISIESDNTGYQGIYRVRPWRYISLDSEDNLNFPSKERINIGSYRDLLYASINELRKGMSNIIQRFSKRYAQLTGGFDSRLVLSFILDAGAKDKFEFITNGHEENPDCIVAKMLAEKYGLHHTCPPRNTNFSSKKSIDDLVKNVCLSNAMESSLIRLQEFAGIEKDVCLNGFGAVFAKSLMFSSSFKIWMNRHFRGSGKAVDYSALSHEQQSVGYDCFGYSNSARSFLTKDALALADEFRKYIFGFNYNRFPDNMNYADSMGAYRWRTHNSNLSTLENNCIFLYSPIVLEASRKLKPELRQDAKLYFDLMWNIRPDICFVPYENRTYNPDIYDDFPKEIREMFNKMPSIQGNIVSEEKNAFFDALTPILRKDLLDMLPTYVFDFIKRETIEMRLKQELFFEKSVFPLINLYGIAMWHEMVNDRFAVR